MPHFATYADIFYPNKPWFPLFLIWLANCLTTSVYFLKNLKQILWKRKQFL